MILGNFNEHYSNQCPYNSVWSKQYFRINLFNISKCV